MTADGAPCVPGTINFRLSNIQNIQRTQKPMFADRSSARVKLDAHRRSNPGVGAPPLPPLPAFLSHADQPRPVHPGYYTPRTPSAKSASPNRNYHHDRRGTRCGSPNLVPAPISPTNTDSSPPQVASMDGFEGPKLQSNDMRVWWRTGDSPPRNLDAVRRMRRARLGGEEALPHPHLTHTSHRCLLPHSRAFLYI